jgi:hypothetical protein
VVSDLHTNGIANCAPTGAQDDMVEVLRAMYKPLSPPWFASNLIEAQQAEIERLRAAGDAMAEALDALCHSYCGNEDDADLVDAWQEARRG